MRQKRSRAMAALLAASLLVLALLPHMAIAEPSDKLFEHLSDFAGEKIASQTGTVFYSYIDPLIPDVNHIYYNDLATQAESVVSGQAAACACDEPIGRMMIAQNPELAIFPEQLLPDEYGYALRKDDRALTDKINGAIRALYAEGLETELAERWFGPDDSKKVMPDFSNDPEYDGSAGVIRMGADPVVEPMLYSDSAGNFIGYEAELIVRVARYLNMKLEFVPSSIATRIESLHSGLIDVAGCCMSITEERKKSVDFTDPYYIGGAVLVVRKDRIVQSPFAALEGKKIGILVGSVYETALRSHVQNPVIAYYDDTSNQFQALANGIIDAVIIDGSEGKLVIKTMPELAAMPGVLYPTNYALAFNKERTELLEEFNQELEKLRQDGTVAKLAEKWTNSSEPPTLGEISKTGARGTLLMATNSSCPPMTYIQDGKMVGYEVELVKLITERLGYGLEISDMMFSGIIASVSTGKSDFAAAAISVTEERAQSVNFSDSTFTSGVIAVVRADDQELLGTVAEATPAPEQLGFWDTMKAGLYKTFVVENRYQLILRGLGVTLIISFSSMVLGTLLGVGLCMLRRSRHKILSVPAKVYIRIIQGLPIVVLLMIFAFVIFLPFKGLDQIWVAVIAFTLNFAAYVAEMLRAGMDAVDKSQLEAADALGFGRFQIFTKIVFPQAARHALPVYRGEVNSQVKTTSIVGYISVMDLTKVSDIIRSRTYDAFIPLLTTAVIYFVLANLLTSLLVLVENRIDPKRRARVLKGVELK